MNTHDTAPSPGETTDAPVRDLIASDRLEGTDVYRPNGEKIGHIDRIMIDKVSGKAAYAVMNFGGLLGIGEDSYPLPWSVLTYNTDLGGYEIDITEDQLEGAPKYARRDDTWWSERDPNRDPLIFSYWGVPPYWV